ncbi:glycosyltransferase [bacterium]|nr:glycosyltransferase [bacterium]
MAFGTVLLVSGSANFSTRDVWDGYRLALEAEGVRVIPYPTFSFLKVLSADSVCNDILGTALDVANSIDGVVFVDGLYFRGQRAKLPRSLRKAGLPTVLIATDDPYDQIPHLDELYTYRFTNEIRSATNGAIYLPTATARLPQIPRVKHPQYDVSFLGTVFEDRLPFLIAMAEFCESHGYRFLIAGNFPTGTDAFQKFASTAIRARTIDIVEKLDIYSQSRLTINLFRESDQPADAPSPRIFEVTAFGQAALLTGPRRSEVTRIYGESVYHFDTTDEAIANVRTALADEAQRVSKVEQARSITCADHLYEHRARQLITTVRAAEQERTEWATSSQERVGWIIGCGRTGSTWLAEMLGDLPKIRRWHEPYFGRFLKHLEEHPEDQDRRASFFFRTYQRTWMDGLRDLFFQMVRARYPQFGRHALVVKEVNTPELYPWIPAIFPQSRLILLLRDPFDVLDSYLDLQKPGSWNQTFQETREDNLPARVHRTATHIRDAMTIALRIYENFPLTQRLLLRYETLLQNPVPGLCACGELLSTPISPEEARQVAERRSFAKYEQTGALQFRRKGQAGAWMTSENFTPEVRTIAEEFLGTLRQRLGYASPDSGN